MRGTMRPFWKCNSLDVIEMQRENARRFSEGIVAFMEDIHFDSTVDLHDEHAMIQRLQPITEFPDGLR
jgi:hypothetical protein